MSFRSPAVPGEFGAEYEWRRSLTRLYAEGGLRGGCRTCSPACSGQLGSGGRLPAVSQRDARLAVKDRGGHPVAEGGDGEGGIRSHWTGHRGPVGDEQVVDAEDLAVEVADPLTRRPA